MNLELPDPFYNALLVLRWIVGAALFVALLWYYPRPMLWVLWFLVQVIGSIQ